MPNHFFYSCYGLNIKSSIFFPELLPGNPNYDVIISVKKYSNLDKFSVNPSGYDKIICSTNDILYFFDGLPLFQVKNGSEINVNKEAEVNAFLRFLILGQGFGTLSMQRGNLVLHSSAIKVGDGAVAFTGWCGSGKSTIATAMNRKGYPFITDDILRIKFDTKLDLPIVFPSFPHVRLWDDSLKFLAENPRLHEKIHPEVEKYSYKVNTGFFLDHIPLTTVFIIENSDKYEIEPLKPQDALIELIKNSYAQNLFSNIDKSENFIQCANLVSKVSVKRLKIVQSFESMEKLLHIIETDIINQYSIY